MKTKQEIEVFTEEALNSMDHASRATPRPYLLTRIHARLRNATETGWERAGRFIARPAVLITGICLVISINYFMISRNNKTVSGNNTAEQQATPDEFSNTVATLYDIENNEP